MTGAQKQTQLRRQAFGRARAAWTADAPEKTDKEAGGVA